MRKFLKAIIIAASEILFVVIVFGGSGGAIFYCSKYLESVSGLCVFSTFFEAYIATLVSFVVLLLLRSEVREREYLNEQAKRRGIFHGRKEEL